MLQITEYKIGLKLDLKKKHGPLITTERAWASARGELRNFCAECRLFYSFSLLRNNNMATNLHVFTSSSGSGSVATCDVLTWELHWPYPGEFLGFDRLPAYLKSVEVSRTAGVVGDGVLAVWEACLPFQARECFASCVEVIKCFEQMRLVTGFPSTNRSAEIGPMIDTADVCYKI